MSLVCHIPHDQELLVEYASNEMENEKHCDHYQHYDDVKYDPTDGKTESVLRILFSLIKISNSVRFFHLNA